MVEKLRKADQAEAKKKELQAEIAAASQVWTNAGEIGGGFLRGRVG